MKNMSIGQLLSAINLGELNLKAVTPEARPALEARIAEMREEVRTRDLAYGDALRKCTGSRSVTVIQECNGVEVSRVSK